MTKAQIFIGPYCGLITALPPPPSGRWPRSGGFLHPGSSRTPGALGYIGYNYVVNDRLNGVQLRNRSGRFVAAGEAAFAEAVNASGMRDSVSGPVSLIDREGAGSWPITETTYVLFERQPRDRERAKLALKFFFWAFQQGDDMARNSGFIPLPTPIQSRAVRLFSEVRDGSGSALNFF